jgi:hypothetical protein
LFITFWNVYAVEESGGGACVENFDCFLRMSDEYLQQEPVENCSSLSFMQMMHASGGLTTGRFF